MLMQTAALLANEQYMRQHPELQLLMHDFVTATLAVKPAHVEAFAKEYFAQLILAPHHQQQAAQQATKPGVAAKV